MKPTEKIYGTLAKPWFFSAKHAEKTDIDDHYLKQAASIIAKCKKLLTLMKDEDVRNTLHAIINKTDALLRMTAEYGKKTEDSDHLSALLAHCQELQREALELPADFPTEKNLAELNYKIATACFYLLVISLCLTAGAAFGAWYFGYLTALYFTETLVGALATIGIPATCLGLVSFGLYEAQSATQVDYKTLADDVGDLCDSIVIGYELAPPSMVY